MFVFRGLILGGKGIVSLDLTDDGQTMDGIAPMGGDRAGFPDVVDLLLGGTVAIFLGGRICLVKIFRRDPLLCWIFCGDSRLVFQKERVSCAKRAGNDIHYYYSIVSAIHQPFREIFFRRFMNKNAKSVNDSAKTNGEERFIMKM